MQPCNHFCIHSTGDDEKNIKVSELTQIRHHGKGKTPECAVLAFKYYLVKPSLRNPSFEVAVFFHPDCKAVPAGG